MARLRSFLNHSKRARSAAALLFVSAALVCMWTLRTEPLAAQAALERGTVNQLSQAMRARIAVSYTKTGRTIPAYHCRHAPEGCETRLSTFAQYLVDAGTQHGIDPWLMAAMAFKESGFNPFALGSLGELGILQINPGRRDAKQVRFIRDEWYRRRCRKEPGACQREVIEHAAQLISRSLERCERDVKDALGLYNTGRCGGNDRYAKRILAERDELLKAAGLAAGKASAVVVASSK
jgi:hypothetical protein